MRKGAETTVRDGVFNVDITLHRLDTQPNCALLHVLAMIENVTDGDGAPQVVTPKYNFFLIDDVNNVFRDLINKISLFYPKVPIGTIENIESEVKPAIVKTDFDESFPVEKMLTSQLLARHHFLGDAQSLNEFHRRMEACGINREKAESFITSDIEIITRLDKRFLIEPSFIKTWFVKLDEAKLKKDPKEYLINREFAISEISKIFDEINWHNANSAQAPWELDAWLQISELCFRGENPFLNVAVTTLTLLGWSYEEAHRYLFNENKLILSVRWGKQSPQIPFTPGVDNPKNASIQDKNPPKTEQTVVDAYKKVIIEKNSSTSFFQEQSGEKHLQEKTTTTKPVKCGNCNSFYDSNKSEQCPYCKTKPPVQKNIAPPIKVAVEPKKQKIRGIRILFLILAIFFGIGVFMSIIMFINAASGADMGDIPVAFLFVFYSLFTALFSWLTFRKKK